MNESKNYGLVIPTQAPEEYVLGGAELPQEILQPNGDWSPFLPPDETQNRYVEPDNCTAYGSIHALETLIVRKYNWRIDYSERALGIMAGTWPPGNDPHNVLETIRKQGLVLESTLPYGPDIDTVEKYYDKISLPVINAEGKRWLQQFSYGHEWLWTVGAAELAQKQASILAALKSSPVNVSVTAWKQRSAPTYLYFKDPGDQDNHWVEIYDAEPGEYWCVFDSYDNTHKQLEWNFDFTIGKRHHIELCGLVPTASQRGWLLEQLAALARWLGLLQKQVDAQPKPFAPQELLTPPSIPAPVSLTPDAVIPLHESLQAMARRVCGEELLTPTITTELLATIQAESGYNPNAIRKNYDVSGRKVLSTDYGICQFNDYWYRNLITPADALHDPEKAVRLMVRQWKKGRATDWVAYKTGAYKQYLARFA